MVLRKILLLILLCFQFAFALAQSYEKRLIMTLPEISDSELQYAELYLGPGDNYCFYYQGSKVVMARPNVGEPLMYGTWYSHKPLVFYGVKTAANYVKSLNDAKIYGPYKGTIGTSYRSSSRGMATAYTVSSADSVSYFIDGICVATVNRIGHKNNYEWPNSWIAPSVSKNRLYTTKKGDWTYLFLNGKLVDSSLHDYCQLDVDEAGNYYYKVCDHDPAYHYFGGFKPLRRKSPITLTRTMWATNSMPWVSAAYENVFSYSDDDTQSYYGNGSGIDYFSTTIYDRPLPQFGITVLTKGKTTFACQPTLILEDDMNYHQTKQRQIGPSRICVNGIGYDLPYEEISYPCLDSFGHYALFGLRDYYLYKNINGIEYPKPLSKHGVRAKPVSIDIQGNTICYYPTDDSVYLYENDKLIRSCVESQFEIQLDKTNQNGIYSLQLPILNMDSVSYIVYNNKLSPPLEKLHLNTGSQFLDGAVVAASLNEYGYWLIQKIGKKKYDLVINHHYIALPKGINFELALYGELIQYFSLTANEFIFYALEDSSIYRYKLKL